MKEQTYISVFEDECGKTIEFERWSYKRLNTCINALVKLYRSMLDFKFVQEELTMATRVVTYKTSNTISADSLVSEIDIATFMGMINSHGEKKEKYDN